jgi:hypothetical protein
MAPLLLTNWSAWMCFLLVIVPLSCDIWFLGHGRGPQLGEAGNSHFAVYDMMG